ncbi:MAG: hypothetical protein ACYSX1_07270 [Planctomycetota bacterium]|jgi:hypothetical protein
MPLNAKSIAVSIAVTFFFGISLVGWITGLAPYLCCKRAAAGALIAYVATILAVRVVNAILTDAIIADQVKRKQEDARDG